jgi:glyoxylase-like metal-dependent hydrolase (beta-lactamase superfamily II)
MNIDIFPLSEGVFTIGHDKIFHPFDTSLHELNDRPRGSLLVEVQPFLLKTDTDYILFDTGLGFDLPGGELQIHHNLKKIGVDPLQITKVVMSHLHKDHAGGISRVNSLGIRELSFVNSTYYVSKNEFNFALEKGSPSYIIDDFELLKNSPQLEWLDEKGTIGGNIFYDTVGGHCPFHLSILVKGEYQTIFFGGDNAPQLKQMKTRYVAKYDYNGTKAMELRQQFALQGKAEDWIFLFYHDVQHAVAHL